MPGALGNYLGWALSNQINQNPALSYLEGVKASSIVPEVALRSAQAQQAMGELEKERKLTGAMQGIDLSQAGGFEKAISATGKIDPIFALKLQATKQAMDVDSRKAFSETLTNTTNYLNNALKGVVTPQQYAGVYANVLKMSPDIAQGMAKPHEVVRPDGSLDNEKINMMTNRAQVIKDTHDWAKMKEMEAFKSELQARRDAASDERQRRMFDHQIEMADKRQAAQGLEQRKGDLDALVDSVDQGLTPPSMLSKRNTKGEYTYILGELSRRGTSLAQRQLQYEAAKKWAGSMNSQQMVRYRGLADSVVNTISDVKSLADQMNLGGFRPVNYLEIEGLMKTAGNTPMGQLATQYVTAVNTLKEEFSNLAQGGYAPTEATWGLANRQINENFGVKQMHASLDEIKRLINFRTTAFENLKPWGAGQFGAPPSGGTPGGLPPGSTLVPGYAPNGKPVYKTPDGKYLEKD